jgi:alkane 1-monooxygenase
MDHAIQAPPPAPEYRDRKRHAWALSLALPTLVGAGPLMMLLSGNALLLWLPVVFNYLAVPLIDWQLGEDASNPPESAVPALEADMYYRRVTYALVPLLWAAFIFGAWFSVHQALPLHGVIALILTTGGVGGFAINLAHEMGHKNTLLERFLTPLTLAPTGYGHFTIEHNRGHHRDVATPRDCASSRMGESIYRFVLREMPGGLLRAWQLEKARLANAQHPLWSLHNVIVQTGLMTLSLWAALAWWLGPQVLPFLLAASFWANFQLTSANYVEHYGLLRRQLGNGRYEPCQPQHSWNSNHIFSNWATFHLQRHSDHHAHPLRRYQSLRHFDNLPELPSGYFGMFPVAYIPPLWFHMMDPRLVAVVKQDASRINFDPRARARLIARYHLSEPPTP